MDIGTDYTSLINRNIGSKIEYLRSFKPDIQVSLSAFYDSDDDLPKVRRKRKSVDSPTWMRIRPVRRRSVKKFADDTDSDPDYDPESSREEVETVSYREPLENIERRLGIPRKPNQYGAIEGVVIGQWWKTRLECSYSGAHRPTVAGIHPGPEGAYSVALSGGYEGDWDLGNQFTFTGEGGRDLKGTKEKPKNLRTAPQSKDQTLTKGNLALFKSYENGNPVRVIRGYKVKGGFAPPDGYRYDGLYKVTKFWLSNGEAGFLIYKYHFTRVENQLPLVDSMDSIMLFSFLKTRDVGGGKRRSSARRRSSVSCAGYGDSEDDEDSDGKRNGTSPAEAGDDGECRDVIDQAAYIEIKESLPTFHKGRFLGFEESSQHADDVFRVFEQVLSVLEDKVTDEVVAGTAPEKSASGSDGNDKNPQRKVTTKRGRKRRAPIRMVRSSKP